MSKLISESLDSFLKESRPMGFERGLDPKAAMNVGYVTQIDKWLEENNTWGTPPTLATKINDALGQCFYKKKTNFIKFIIDTFNNFDKDTALRNCLNYDAPQFMDALIKKGAEFDSLPNKAKYIVEYKGTLVSFTPQEEFLIACKVGDFEDFKKYIKQGVKLSMAMFNSLFQDDSDYRSIKKVDQKDEIKQWLRDHIDELDTFAKDIKKVDRMKTVLAVKPSVDRKYPHGYKIYRALKWIDETHPKSKSEILKFIYELGRGKGSFNPLLHGSHWTDGYSALIRPVCNIAKKTDDEVDGTHTLNALGKVKLAKLEKKFGTMKIDPPPYI